eukprot:g5536.t1
MRRWPEARMEHYVHVLTFVLWTHLPLVVLIIRDEPGPLSKRLLGLEQKRIAKLI